MSTHTSANPEIADDKKMELRHTIDVADIAEIIFALINEETHHLAAIQPRNDISLASGKDNEPSAALPTTTTQEQLAI